MRTRALGAEARQCTRLLKPTFCILKEFKGNAKSIMELIRGRHNLRPRHRGCAVTVGAFDGVHRGHQTVLQHLREEAGERGLKTAVITFEPLPREYFHPLEAPPRIMTLREKTLALAAQGVDYLLALRFDDLLRAQSADEFLQTYLVEGLAAAYIVLGDDFHFGNAREGDYQFLVERAAQYGYHVAPTPTCEVVGDRVSSTRVRDALAQADFSLATALLGHPFSLSGRVVHGRKMGRELGWPTANIELHRIRSPLSGVFAVRVDGAGLKQAHGVANVGVRPTVDDSLEANLEVHLLDRAVDLYGRRLQVTFLHKLRDEKKFDSLADLKSGIAQDVEHAKHWLACNDS